MDTRGRRPDIRRLLTWPSAPLPAGRPRVARGTRPLRRSRLASTGDFLEKAVRGPVKPGRLAVPIGIASGRPLRGRTWYQPEGHRSSCVARSRRGPGPDRLPLIRSTPAQAACTAPAAPPPSLAPTSTAPPAGCAPALGPVQRSRAEDRVHLRLRRPGRNPHRPRRTALDLRLQAPAALRSVPVLAHPAVPRHAGRSHASSVRQVQAYRTAALSCAAVWRAWCRRWVSRKTISPSRVMEAPARASTG